MSVENIKAFMDKAKSDEGLKAKLQGKENADDLIAVGKEAGYEFNQADLQEYLKHKQSSGEVSQDDLEKVSGGTITISPIIVMTVTVCR